MQGLFAGISVVGEGHDGPENPPIDVHDHKLLGWLLERRKLNAKWPNQIRSIKDKVNAAVPQLPSENKEISELLANNPELNYFVCKRIFDILAQTDEAKEKSIFGQYSSARLKAWQEIVKAYESDNVYLGEIAQQLVNYVKYEVPALKRKLERCKKQIEDLSRKEGEQARSSKEYAEKFKQSCSALGIEGKDVQKELEALVSILPELLKPAVDKVQATDALEKAVIFYHAFTSYSLSVFQGEEYKEVDIAQVCPTLMYVYKHGNVSVREMLGIKAPEKEKGKEKAEKGASEISIDWGDIPSESASGEKEEGGPVAIDWGDASGGIEIASEGESGGAAPVIDWGEIPSAEGGEDGAPTINWDIEIEEEGGGEEGAAMSVGSSPKLEIEVVDDLKADSSSSDIPEEFKNANLDETILENVVLRNRFINDLLELHAFLKQRDMELQGSANIVIGNQLEQSAPTAVRQTSAEAVQTYLNVVESVQALLNVKKLRQVIDIKTSKRLCTRLAASINQHLSVANALQGSIDETQRRRQDLEDQLKQAYPRLNLVKDVTKALKKETEAALSNLFGKRVINIIGEINNI